MLRIGVLGEANPTFGLRRDVDCLLWALGSLSRGRCSTSYFPVHGDQSPVGSACVLPGSDRPRATVAEGAPFADWLDGLDVLLIVEYTWPDLLERCARKRIRVVLVANLDWAVIRDTGPREVGRWVALLRDLGVEVWAKTPRSHDVLCSQGVRSRLVPWSIPDPVRPARRCRRTSGLGPNAAIFFMNAGRGGVDGRRGVDIAIAAFLQASERWPRFSLILKALVPLEDLVGESLAAAVRASRRVRVFSSFSPRQDVDRLYDLVDFVLFPSRWEGFGLPLLEALHQGVPVLATDGWPMNELVVAGHNGALIWAEERPPYRLAARWECSPSRMAESMVSLAADSDLRRGLAREQTEALIDRKSHFCEVVARNVMS
jgi:glycosyltransferase involved in cell wall biosynthesis